MSEPPPHEAYRLAPGIADELDWITRQAAVPYHEPDRTYWLRKTAVYDRIALRDDPDGTGPATQDAEAVAYYLLDGESAWTEEHSGATRLPDAPVTDPRAYVRQQYHAWHRTDLLAQGRCPNCAWLDYQCNCADHPDA